MSQQTQNNATTRSRTSSSAAEDGTTGASDSRWTLERLHEKLQGCQDVVHIETSFILESGEHCPATLFYCTQMVDTSLLQQSLLPALQQDGGRLLDGSDTSLMMISDESDAGQNIFEMLFSGAVLIVLPEGDRIYASFIGNITERQPDESVMEVSLKGPRDGFVESINVNVSLVRRRLKTPDLQCEIMTIGSRSGTEVAFMYMASLADEEMVAEAKRRLREIAENVVSIDSSTQIESLMSDKRFTLFPLVTYTGRPDYAASSLLSGRFIVIVNGNPAVIMGPTDLAFLIKSPEDLHMPYFYVSLERMLRFVGLFFSIFLPGFWIALCSFNTDQIPFNLLATISTSRNGLPVSTTMEMFLMLLMFELFREAGVRLPRAVGQTVSVVGGLIVGNAAIDAGLTSPTMLVIAAVTAVSTFVLVNQTLNGTVTVLRLLVLVMVSFMGMLGFFLSMFAIVIHLCSLESFGRPYMAPLASMRFRLMPQAFLQLPWVKRRRKGGQY
ncbi:MULTISPECIES: spore germination protein [unclassified Paenibacillus]|uniref:spore germination protein n=1 Tax=unclassified Paenibacillus TaxID=185978 RepID=UPI0009556187|nr:MULTISPECIES: spore germination protein [unclassified Paenibacillus]ASS64822.1 spore germination protein [Paenibacillus sp. RUD330]SIR04891.1 GerA spore germination protein [Paenibacillus sp. RU4X]SIR30439.1 GerA spore germination protein [Paenibacillus sp. RU4T]